VVKLKERYIKFLTDRIFSKLEDIAHHATTHEEVVYFQEEASYYLQELKSVLKEILEGVQ
jgi:hypothetical protein